MRLIGREAILRMVPHAGEMCLLDEILAWDAVCLRCRSKCFDKQTNPLRRADGRLGMASAIELAGQAMALHGRLLADTDATPLPGMLVSLRDVAFGAGPLPAAELLVEIEWLMGGAEGASYGFRVAGADGVLLTGRATVIFGVER